MLKTADIEMLPQLPCIRCVWAWLAAQQERGAHLHKALAAAGEGVVAKLVVEAAHLAGHLWRAGGSQRAAAWGWWVTYPGALVGAQRPAGAGGLTPLETQVLPRTC